MQSLYRRPLPPTLVAFASPEGRTMFDAARAEGGMEAFFPLIEQFHTQADPAFCGLGTLVVALNALGVDPGRLWKGPWRWFSEDLLDCCSPLERVRTQGITLDEFACLARCNGAGAEVFRPDTHSLADLRAAISTAARSVVDPAMIVSYDRRTLGQTGDGHFSPVGGYHAASDHALILDVARFKYPPHWVPLSALYSAMQPADAATTRPRGWVALRRSSRPASLLFTARCVGDGGFAAFSGALERLRVTIAAAASTEGADLRSVLADMFTILSADLTLVIEQRSLALTEHAAAAEALLAALRSTPVFTTIADLVSPSWPPEAATLLVLALPRDLWSPMPDAVRTAWLDMLDPDNLPPPVRLESDHIHRQLADLCTLGPTRSCARCA